MYRDTSYIRDYLLPGFGEPFFKCSNLDVEPPFALRKLESVLEGGWAFEDCQHSFFI